MTIEFPKDFFWGAATSAYQVEGNNTNSDWWAWEKKAGLKETSGLACRHYELFREDFDLAKQLNHNTHRLSVEWSRIEPQAGRFSSLEIEHYRQAILYLKALNIEPVVTLHHFTCPQWFANLGGWHNKEADKYFLRFVERIVDALSGQVRFWVTINEPMVYVYHGYLLGVWPPQEQSLLKAISVADKLILAHIKAYKLIHSVYKKRNLSYPFVSIAKNMQAFEPCRPNLRNRFAAWFRDEAYNLEFINRLVKHNTLDFIGVNYYTRGLVEAKKWSIKSMLLDTCKDNHSQLEKNSLGWDIYPQGLYSLLIKLKRYNLPVFILENGICTEDEDLRWDFICQHLKKISLALTQGVRAIGYIYWSLIDNYEWDKGFSPHFGLIKIDYGTYQRSIKESAKKFAQVCKTAILQ